TDGSVELLRRIPNVEIRKVPWVHPDSMVATLQALHNSCWKESRGVADWVIVADIDEFLYHPDFLGYLRRSRKRGVTCIPALGYEMLSERFPGPDETLTSTVRRGVPLLPPPGLEIRSERFPGPDETLTSTVRRGVPHDMMNKLRLFDPNAVE